MSMEPAVRHTPEDIAGVRKCLHGYPPYMKVEIRGGRKDCGRPLLALDMAARLDLELPQPGDRYAESVVVVERAS